ncbi:MAG TPA: AAA family ATPase, partial [Pirellulales bacterium]|nr:AAA family ATPase [Pirellulales bacterium]
AEAARSTLDRCIDRGEGIGLLIGPAGTGKTLLCQVLAEQFRSRMAIALLSSGRICTRRSLFQAILFELGLRYRGMEEGELRLALADHLTNIETHQDALLLLLDEAHTLPLRLLEEVRLLTNLVRNGHPRVRLVLSGASVMEERIASPKLDSFNQRIVARCYLQALNYDETLAYIRGEIANVGGNADQVFTLDALQSVHRATDGIPRLVNQVCDHALISAYANGARPISQAVIEEAWADLQQLPTPWNAAAGAADQPRDIIEFGALEDVVPLKPPRESAAAPRLRAVREEERVGDDGETDLFYGEPVERLAKIEAKLEAIEEDYQPPVPEVPRVDVVFPGAFDPFAEAFVEEEVVTDRFATLETSVLSNRPQVRSLEGRELSALLGMNETASDPEHLSINEVLSLPAADETQETSQLPELEARSASADAESPRNDESESEQPLSLRPAEDPVLPEFPEESGTVSILIGGQTVELPQSEIPGEALTFSGRFQQTVNLADATREPLQAASEPTTLSPDLASEDEQDLIVVEDDPPEPNPPAPMPPQVRRQEYRQLFARLRRG